MNDDWMNKPVTWQLVTILVIVLLLVIPSAWLGAIIQTRAALIVTGSIVVISLGLITALTVSHWRAGHRRDLAVDVLASLFGEHGVGQLGDLHVVPKLEFFDGMARVLVVVQNLFDASRTLELALPITKGQEAISPPCGLQLEISASGVCAACIDLPLGETAQETRIRMEIVGRCQGTGGRKVRFGRRVAITHRVGPVLLAAAAAGGAVVWGGETYLEGIVPASTGRSGVGGVACWRYQQIWHVGDSSDKAVLRRRIRQLCDAPSSPDSQ